MSTLECVLICAITAVLVISTIGLHSIRGKIVTDADEGASVALRIAGQAAPHLRSGLTRDSARKAVRHLRALLGTEAIAITDGEQVLARDGALAAGDDIVLRHASAALGPGRTRVVTMENGGAVAVPLLAEGTVIGALLAYDERISAACVRTAGEVARWVSGQLELAQLDIARARAAEAEMQALRAQISPHFIYNSLTTIASFCRSDSDRARDLLLDFADFARYAFRAPHDFVTLSDELSCIDRYLLLERARFGDRLRFTVQVAPEVLTVVVPFLCLQPLVENAIRHGMEGRAGEGRVKIVARDAGPEAHISVEDDGCGMAPERLRGLFGEGRAGSAPRGSGIGLVNVDERMRQVFGPEYGLAVETAPEAGTKIMIRVPKYRQGVTASQLTCFHI